MKTIFIVDDHPPVIRVIRLALEGAGYAVESASNGLDCLEAIREKQPDFLVTDIDMPKMSGKKLCAAIQMQIPDRQFPIAVLTSRTEFEHRQWTQSIPNLCFMEKPVSVRRLLALIKQSLDGAEQELHAVQQT